MKIGCLFAVCALLGSLCALPGLAQTPSDYAIFAQDKPQTFDDMITALGKADVVFVGEQHDNKPGHALELAILKGMHARNPSLALSLEMFERDVQGVVDEYLAGYITESHFLQASRPWPNYKDDYRPLLEFCRENHLPVIAANAPRRYVNIVSRKGPQALQELPKTSRANLAPLPYSMELPAEYDRQLTELFGGAHDQAAANSKSGTTSAPPSASPGMPSPENMKAAQGLWDATMADSILRFQRANHSRKILQINGSMHSDSGYGIVDRLRKRAGQLKILVVTIQPEDDFTHPPVGKYAGTDFVILTRPEPQPSTPSK